MLKKLLQNSILGNQRGSTLSITIVVIAVLAFSVTSVTRMTINLSGSTTQIIENVNDESIGKGLITQAINEFETYIQNGGTFEDFNNVESVNIESKYNVGIDDVTSLYPDFGTVDATTTYVYRFEFVLSTGDTIYKLVYAASEGSSFETPKPVEFSVATEGDLILNGGLYLDTKLYGTNIFMSKQSPWIEYEYGTPTHHLTPAASGTYPDFDSGVALSDIYYNNSFEYCASSCFTVTENGSSNVVLNLPSYQEVAGSGVIDESSVQGDFISSFFNEFDVQEFSYDLLSNDLPTESRTFTDTYSELTFRADIEQMIRDNSAPITYGSGKGKGGNNATYPNTAFVDLTNDSNYDLETSDNNFGFSAMFDAYTLPGNTLVVEKKFELSNHETEGIIILGNLTLDNTANGKNQKVKGNVFVTGDLTLTGNSMNFDEVNFVVLGEVIMDFNYEEGFRTISQNYYELTIVAHDNIRFERFFEVDGLESTQPITMLAYSEESIFINAVASYVNIEGALLAKAKGDSANPIGYEYSSGSPIQGIVINSFKGYVNRSYGGGVKSFTYPPSTNDSYNRFSITPIDVNAVTSTFMNIPMDLVDDGVTIIDGNITFEESEWKKD